MYSNDPHYRELIAILAEILAQGQRQPAPAVPPDPAPMIKQELETRPARPDPVALVVQPCEEVQ